MSIESALAIAFVSFLLLHTWHKRWQGNPTQAARLPMLRAAVAYLRTVALVATAVYTILTLSIVLMGLFDPRAVTVEDFAAAMEKAHRLRALMGHWSGHISYTVLSVLLIGLFILSVRHSGKNCREPSAQVGESGDGCIQEPPGQLTRIETIVTSRGLLNTLDGGSRLAFRCGLGMLLLSLVAVSGGMAGNAVNRYVILRLERLHLEHSAQKARESYEQASLGLVADAPEPETDQDAQDDYEALDYLAWRFEESVGNALVDAIGNGASLPPTMPGIGSIIQSALEASSVIQLLTEMEREAFGLFSDSASSVRRPQTALGDVFREDLETQVVRQSPSVWANMRKRVRAAQASFDQPVTLRELDGRIFSHVFGMAIDLRAAPAGELGMVAHDLSNEIMSSGAQRLYENARAQALESLVGTADINEGFDNFTQKQMQYFGIAKNLSAKIGSAMARVPRAASVLIELDNLCAAALTAVERPIEK